MHTLFVRAQARACLRARVCTRACVRVPACVRVCMRVIISRARLRVLNEAEVGLSVFFYTPYVNNVI